MTLQADGKLADPATPESESDNPYLVCLDQTNQMFEESCLG